MPTQEQLKNQKLNEYSFEESRDYKGSDFLNYVTPSFYRVDDTAIESFIKWDTLRLNGELIAINEPELSTALLFPPTSRVSPQLPIGLYKKNAIATVYYWHDGNQITQQYQLQSLSRQSVETLSEQQGKMILTRFLDEWGSLAEKASIFGIGEKFGDIADYLINQLNAEDVFGIWIPIRRVTQPLKDIFGASSESVLEGYCRNNPNDPLCTGETDKQGGSILPLVLAGAGIVTGNLWLSGVGLLLRLRTTTTKEEEEEETLSTIPKRGQRTPNFRR